MGGLHIVESCIVDIKVKLLSEHAKLPQYMSVGAAGFDFHSAEDKLIMPGETALISTGLAFRISDGYEIQVRPRSGLSAKTGIRVANAPGTLDCDYLGEVKIILDNTGSTPFTVNIGDRIAQGIAAPVYRASFEVVEELGVTERGTKGFGSTDLVLSEATSEELKGLPKD